MYDSVGTCKDIWKVTHFPRPASLFGHLVDSIMLARERKVKGKKGGRLSAPKRKVTEGGEYSCTCGSKAQGKGATF